MQQSYDLAIFLGTLLVVRGVLSMLSLPLDGSARVWSFVMGLLEVGVGIALFAWPEPTLLVVAAFIGWWVLFSGVMTIAGSVSARHFLPYWGLWLALGIGEVVVAFWLLQQPGLTLVSAVLAIGLWSIFYGIVTIAALSAPALAASSELRRHLASYSSRPARSSSQSRSHLVRGVP